MKYTKRNGFAFTCAMSLLLLTTLSCKQVNKSQMNEITTFQNPLKVEFGDPYILDDGNGMYYLYGTGG